MDHSFFLILSKIFDRFAYLYVVLEKSFLTNLMHGQKSVFLQYPVHLIFSILAKCYIHHNIEIHHLLNNEEFTLLFPIGKHLIRTNNSQGN